MFRRNLFRTKGKMCIKSGSEASGRGISRCLPISDNLNANTTEIIKDNFTIFMYLPCNLAKALLPKKVVHIAKRHELLLD